MQYDSVPAPNQEILHRVTVEREEDWLRVQANVNKALNESLQSRLATLPEGERKRLGPRLEKEFEALKERMWEMTKSNLRVNGFNYEDYVETTEPFDESLDRSIWSLNTERVQWESKVVGTRAHHAQAISNALDDLEIRRAAAEWHPSAEEKEELAQAVADAKEVRPEDFPPPPRHAEVVETFQQVVANMSDLVESAPKQRERAERMHQVRDEIARLQA